MLRLDNVPQEEMPEVVRIAAELYEKDQANAAAAEQRETNLKATVDAAAEVGLPPEYLQRAAAEMHARRVARIRQQRRRRNGLFGGLAVIVTLCLIGWGVGHIANPPAAPRSVFVDGQERMIHRPFVYHFSAAGEQWLKEANSQSKATVAFENGIARIRVERFGQKPDGTYFVNLNSANLPPALSGYRQVGFRVRGTGLSQIRLYLENGPTERWRSNAVVVDPDWRQQTLPLDRFEHQTRGSSADTWRSVGSSAPDTAQRLSFKVGTYMNDVTAHGEIDLQDLRFE